MSEVLCDVCVAPQRITVLASFYSQIPPENQSSGWLVGEPLSIVFTIPP